MIIAFFILGIICGSFVNAFVWRLEKSQNKQKADKTKYSIINGRSICPKCEYQLSLLDLIPIFSWIYLRGKCRYCHKTISPQYPIIELITGAAFFISYTYWPLRLTFWGYLLLCTWLIILILLVSLALYDFKYKILPNNLIYVLLIFSCMYILIDYFSLDKGNSYIFSRLLGVIFSSGIFYLIYQFSKGKWIGGGDVKLCLSLGLLVGGPLEAILMLFIASVLGSFIAIILLITSRVKANMVIAFGPLLIISTFICFLFGTQIINWYTSIVI